MAKAVDELSAAVQAVAALDLAGASVDELHELLAVTRQAIDQLGAKRLDAIEHLNESGAWALDGSRTCATHLARLERGRIVAARHETALAATVHAHLPRAREAALAGELGLDHLRALAGAADTEPRRQALHDPDRGEAWLLAQARRLNADAFAKVVASWVARVDPKAGDDEGADIRAAEHLRLARAGQGWSLTGFLAPDSAQLLRTALDAITGVPASDDDRTPQQRDAASLVGLARLALDSGQHGSGAAVRPHLSVHVSWQTLQNLASATGANLDPARLADGTPLPRWLLERLACDSDLTRIVFGPDGQVLDVGRTRRRFTGALRRALEARDQHCVWQGCTEPPSRCEGHHLREWEAGGATSIDNGALLCWWHHEFLHKSRLRLARLPGHDPGDRDRWVVTRDDGSRHSSWRADPPPWLDPAELAPLIRSGDFAVQSR